MWLSVEPRHYVTYLLTLVAYAHAFFSVPSTQADDPHAVDRDCLPPPARRYCIKHMEEQKAEKKGGLANRL